MKCDLKKIPDNSIWDDARQIIQDNERCRNSILGKALEPCSEEYCKITVLVSL
jgi:hypothetical protein